MKFDMDNPIIRLLGRISDLLVLNLMTALFCLPVITIGASLTALHTCAMKLTRGEETVLALDFLRAFRDNFKKGTLAGLLLGILLLVLYLDYTAAGARFPLLRPAALMMAVLVLLVWQYVFFLLSRYENTLLKTLQNALLLSIGFLPRTLGIGLFAFALWLACLSNLIYGVPVLFICGLSLPAYCAALLLKKVFDKLEADSVGSAG